MIHKIHVTYKKCNLCSFTGIFIKFQFSVLFMIVHKSLDFAVIKFYHKIPFLSFLLLVHKIQFVVIDKIFMIN